MYGTLDFKGIPKVITVSKESIVKSNKIHHKDFNQANLLYMIQHGLYVIVLIYLYPY